MGISTSLSFRVNISPPVCLYYPFLSLSLSLFLFFFFFLSLISLGLQAPEGRLLWGLQGLRPQHHHTSLSPHAGSSSAPHQTPSCPQQPQILQPSVSSGSKSLSSKPPGFLSSFPLPPSPIPQNPHLWLSPGRTRSPGPLRPLGHSSTGWATFQVD